MGLLAELMSSVLNSDVLQRHATTSCYWVIIMVIALNAPKTEHVMHSAVLCCVMSCWEICGVMVRDEGKK